jgi:glyoxylase-like metal-dependent hydrolase (beta-lactamase superfamily II)
MKRLHRPDLFSWSVFHEPLNVDFNGFLWTRPEGNVLFDPVAMSPHDRAHLRELGGAAWIVLTNSAHVRATAELVAAFGAKVAGPRQERDAFPLRCDRWLADGEEVVPGLTAFELEGSKTPGELALFLAPETLLTGDLVRAHRAGSLMFLLPQQGLRDAAKARASVARLLERPIDAVLVGDGFCVYRDGQRELEALVKG